MTDPVLPDVSPEHCYTRYNRISLHPEDQTDRLHFSTSIESAVLLLRYTSGAFSSPSYWVTKS